MAVESLVAVEDYLRTAYRPDCDYVDGELVERFRILDVMVLSGNAPDEEIVRTPPLLSIEILSGGDTPRQMRKRAGDYFSIGVPACWIIDPSPDGPGTAYCAPALSRCQLPTF